MSMPVEKYRPYAPVELPDRHWPDRVIECPPTWCSVDLRDGNQALVDPMDAERKLILFEQLVAMGFKQIEVGFPSASEIEYDFVRLLVDEDRIPDDVTIQVLTQSREALIRRTVESLRGVRRAIVHLYNSTSALQRRVVFGLGRRGIVDLAVSGTRLIRELVAEIPDTEVVFEYSPESFTGTELGFAVEICEAVMEAWEPSVEQKMILNLPATVEMATPNVYADQIEWFGSRIRGRERCVLSVHPHNDRGTAVAAAELAVMAGAERVEGTLFGNGERTGNVDLVTLALNLFTQGVDPGLDMADMSQIVRVAEHCTRLPVHPRHPYAGELVFTAFSGSHQDAIKKGLAVTEPDRGRWEVPYLPMDPADVGRSYEAVIRINSQSGKGGIAYLMERDHGFHLPRGLQIEFRERVQVIADRRACELSSAEIRSAFDREYLSKSGPLVLREHALIADSQSPGSFRIRAVLEENGIERIAEGQGNGPIDAFVEALRAGLGLEIRVIDYREHALGRGADASAVAYLEIASGEGRTIFGVGLHPNIVTASLEAVVSAVNRLS
jgi:2-isopropylmalate synthase